MKRYGYGRQSISGEDIEAVRGVLQSDFLTQGPEVAAFEAELCRYTGAKYCVAVSSATAGLHLAMLALGVRAGEEGITSPNTFLSSANCMLYTGAAVRFVDIEPDTGNLDPAKLEAAITPHTRVIVPVHYAGQSCDMEAVSGIARKHGLRVVEDAAHAIGSEYRGEKVGSCRYSDCTVFSFHPVKTITTGEGGAVTTNDPGLYERLLMLRSHGVTRDPERLERNDGPWYYEMQDLGFNYRMNDLQAALGRSQLKRIGQFRRRRREIVAFYREVLATLSGVSLLSERPFSEACFHLCPLLVDFSGRSYSKPELFERLRGAGLHLQVHYIPVHLQPYYRRKFGYSAGDFPVAEEFYRREISLPLYPDLTTADLEYICGALTRCIESA